ncbi:MAG: class I SAM-dependent methyltransferase [Thiobacillus sp.]|nr:class I SAM-dependent methyltransferase [Thiobacillus sp.]
MQQIDPDLADNPESIHGQTPYLQVIELLQTALAPGFYLEIGVRNGGSLRFAKCPAIGVDPAAAITFPLGAATRLANMTSDEFFAGHADRITQPVDLAFIDGMHLFEYALRDFINIEKLASPHAVVVVDDICPNHPLQADRDRKTRVWTGDVWKLRACLEKWRPDLRLVLLDTNPTGLLLIFGLDPENTVLADNYEAIVGELLAPEHDRPPAWIMARKGALAPDLAMLGSVFRGLRALRHSHSSRTEQFRLLALLAPGEA